LAAKYLDAGDWYAMAILDGDQVVGRVWMATRVDNQLLNGIMHVRLRDDEAYGFDLYIEPEHRRGSISSFIADACISELQRRGTRIGYTHLMFDNPPSVMWHHMVGFNWLQVYNMISIGERFVMKIPFSESPRFGPLSRRGRHSEEPPPDPFGGALIPH
jgi:GNAT superfamily N-acetyltransferase